MTWTFKDILNLTWSDSLQTLVFSMRQLVCNHLNVPYCQNPEDHEQNHEQDGAVANHLRCQTASHPGSTFFLFHRKRRIERHLLEWFYPYIECFNENLLLPLQAHRNNNWTTSQLHIQNAPPKLLSQKLHRLDFNIYTSLYYFHYLRFSTTILPVTKLHRTKHIHPLNT